MSNELIPSVSITHFCQQRDLLIEEFDSIVNRLIELNALASKVKLSLPNIKICPNHENHGYELTHDKNKSEAMKIFISEVDLTAWKYLMAESGMRSFMCASARETWDTALNNCRKDIPVVSVATVAATFSALHDSRGKLLEDGIIECFKSLSWIHKTNLPQMFGKKIIIADLMNSHHGRKVNQLDDLMRVFYKVDKKPEPDHRNGVYLLLQNAGGLSCVARVGTGVVENDYISIKWFMNGNGHITFKRPDLVAHLNRIIAAHYPNALPAPK